MEKGNDIKSSNVKDISWNALVKRKSREKIKEEYGREIGFYIEGDTEMMLNELTESLFELEVSSKNKNNKVNRSYTIKCIIEFFDLFRLISIKKKSRELSEILVGMDLSIDDGYEEIKKFKNELLNQNGEFRKDIKGESKVRAVRVKSKGKIKPLSNQVRRVDKFTPIKN